MKEPDRSFTRTLPWIALAGVTGALAFALAQKLAGFPQTIPEFMGSQIVTRGGYNPSLTGLIGWGVHFGVALAYAILFTLVRRLPGFPRTGAAGIIGGLALVALLGWVSTLITAPAIAITIELLAGQGLPATIPPLNTALGFVFWNHVVFFAIVWLITAVAPAALDRRRDEPTVAGDAV